MGGSNPSSPVADTVRTLVLRKQDVYPVGVRSVKRGLRNGMDEAFIHYCDCGAASLGGSESWSVVFDS